MNPNRSFGLWKAIAFLTTVFFSIFFFVSCCDLYPPTVKTVSAKFTEGFFITATGQIISDGGADVTSCGLCLSLNPMPTISDIRKAAISAVNSEYTVYFTGLELCKTYYVRAYAINSEGVAYGDVISIVTSVTPSVKSTAVSLITKTEATLSAVINSLNSDTENWFEYWTMYGTVQRITAGTSNGSSDVTLSVKVSGLIPGTTYSFVAKSKNEYGETSGDTLTFETYAVVDYDGNLYHTVSYSGTYTRDYDGQKDVIFTVNQTWLKENFKGTHYANGDPIPNVANAGTWADLTTGAYCQYNNDSKIAEVYGNLYNWYVGADPRGLIIGWHTPTSYEFGDLGNYLADGVTPKAGPMMMETGTAHWINPSPYNPPTNSSGFTALPNGAFAQDKDTNNWVYMNLGESATFWTASPIGSINAMMVEISRDHCWLDIGAFYHKTIYCGLRLIKNG